MSPPSMALQSISSLSSVPFLSIQSDELNDLQADSKSGNDNRTGVRIIDVADEPDYLAEAIIDGMNLTPATEIVDEDACVRRACKAVAFFFSAVAKLPYAPLSMRLPCGALLATANCSAFFKWEIISTFNMVDDIFMFRGSSEIILLQRNGIKKSHKIAIALVALIASLFSQLPISLPAFDAVDSPYDIPAFALLLGAGSFLPLRSLYCTVEESFKLRKYVLNETGKKLQSMREGMCEMIQEYRQDFIDMEMDEQLARIETFSKIREMGSTQDKTHALATAVFTQKPSTASPPSLCSRVCDYASTAVGALFAASFETAITMYTYQKTKDYLIDSNAVAGVFAGSVAISWAYLCGTTNIQTIRRSVKGIYNWVIGKKEKSLAEKLRPNLTLSLKLMGFLLDAAAFGPTIIIWSDFYKNNRKEETYFLVTIISSLFLSLYSSTLDITERMAESVAEYQGDREETQIIQFHKGLAKLQALMKESSLLDFCFWLSRCPAGIKTTFLERAGLASEQLEKFVNGIEERSA